MNFIKSQLCLCILLPFLFFSCGERYNRGVLQEKKMVDVMVDVHLVEGMSEQNLLNQNNHSTSNVYYNNLESLLLKIPLSQYRFRQNRLVST